MQKQKPILAKRIFWDVKFEDIDYDKYWEFVICRAFERGEVEDIRQVRRFYGDDKVIEAITKSKWLFYETFSLAKNMFDLKETEFRCYMLNHSRGIPWTY